MKSEKERWINRLAATFVFLFVLVVYVRTMAVSVSFWDCGEFIACAHILGIPHPPGAPLYGLLGRLFSLLPLFETVARRVNFLSVLTGALAAGMLYLVVERVSRNWFSENMGWRGRLLGMAGGVTAGLWMAFSDTFWSNTVESEVYGPASFLMVLVIWLALRLYEERRVGGGDGLLILLVYLFFLGISVHLTIFLIFPAVFLLLVLSEGRSGQWAFWLCLFFFFFSGLLVLFFARFSVFYVLPERWLGQWRFWLQFVLFWFGGSLIFLFPWSREHVHEWRLLVVLGLLMAVVGSLAEPLIAVVFSALAFSLLGMLMGGRKSLGRWRLCFWVVVFVILGLSLQAFIPLRSALDPVIDENDPETWTRFMDYLERKQYGQTSMLEGMFHRKGSWLNQFGVHPRMGFWGFFRQGWAPVGWWPVVLGVGLLGMVVGWFRERRRWWYLLVLMLICSCGVVVWMNFSDGTRGIQLEVRDRDYFFTPTYLAFSLWMGLGVSGLLWLVLRKLKGLLGQIAFWILMAALLISPLGTLAYNYHRHDRSRNWIAHDYAYNLLGSCHRDGILFTNGDNDTFPLWYIQEVEGYRKDVRVVNLSLLNTGWYIKQLHNMEPRVATGYSDEQADALTPIRWPEDKQIDLGGFTLSLKSGQILRVQDRAMLNIIRVNRWQRPVYIAITVSPENKLGLDEHLRMESMALRLVPEEGSNMIDLDRSHDLIMNQHVFRGLNDETIYKDENTIKLLTNYAASFAAVGQAYCNLGQTSGDPDYYIRAEEVLEKGVEVLYPFWGIYQVLSKAYDGLGEIDKAIEAGKEAIFLAGEQERPMIYANLLPVYQRNDRIEDLISFLNERIENDADEFSAYLTLFRINHTLGRVQEAAAALERWLSIHPEDTNARQFLTDYRNRMMSTPEQTGE